VVDVKAETKPEVKAVVKAEVVMGKAVEKKTGAPEKEAVEKKTGAPEKEAVEIKAEVKEKPAATQKGQETGKPILADKFSTTDTIGEKTTSVRQDEAITSALHNKPISDIGAAIGINDKFYFIRELFSGDSRAYQDTIKRLNSSASLGEAMKILDENTVMGSDPAAQSSFVDIVRRKFNINV
jgi:uncharacterized protein YbjQ (UPF0145 family)